MPFSVEKRNVGLHRTCTDGAGSEFVLEGSLEVGRFLFARCRDHNGRERVHNELLAHIYDDKLSSSLVDYG